MSKANNVTGWYETVLKGWQAKALGPKPTAELFTQAHALGCRPGKQALAMAMYLRDGGATDGQVKMACIIQWGSSGSHHNKRRDIISAGFAKAKPVVSDTQGHKVYAITLTAKGVTKAAVTEKPAKAATKATKATTKVKAVPATVTATPAPAEAPAAQVQPQG
jgi:hypothetical protein